MRAIDLFAGAGGFSTGAVQAGVRVLWSADHWQLAVKYHALNHPATAHSCQDLHQADFTTAPAHDLLLASPSCTGHSRARGVDRPSHDAARATAWAVVTCAEVHRPTVVLVENVPEFEGWILYRAWREAMRALGYSIAAHLTDAADYGVPQNRKRLILVCTRSKRPLFLTQPKMPHIPALDVIDFAAGAWSQVERDGRASATLGRFAKGRADFGQRFLLPYYKSTLGGRSLNRPIGTLTTKPRYAVVDGDRMRMLTVAEAVQFMGFPADYWLPANSNQANHLLGNAICPPVAKWFVQQVMGRT